MCAVFSLWLKVGHGNTETALKVENDATYQLCNVATPPGLHTECALIISKWLQSSQSVYHSEREDHLNRSQELEILDTYFIFIRFLIGSSLCCALRRMLFVTLQMKWEFQACYETKRNRWYSKSDQAWQQHRQICPHEFNACQKGEEHMNAWKMQKRKWICWSVLPQRCWCICSRHRDKKRRRGRVSTRQQRSKTNWRLVDIFHHPLNKYDKYVWPRQRMD